MERMNVEISMDREFQLSKTKFLPLWQPLTLLGWSYNCYLPTLYTSSSSLHSPPSRAPSLTLSFSSFRSKCVCVCTPNVLASSHLKKRFLHVFGLVVGWGENRRTKGVWVHVQILSIAIKSSKNITYLKLFSTTSRYIPNPYYYKPPTKPHFSQSI